MPFRPGDPATHAAARKGDTTTAARYGRSHMQAIGKRGFAVVKAKPGVDAHGNVWDPYAWLLFKLGYVPRDPLRKEKRSA